MVLGVALKINKASFLGVLLLPTVYILSCQGGMEEHHKPSFSKSIHVNDTTYCDSVELIGIKIKLGSVKNKCFVYISSQKYSRTIPLEITSPCIFGKDVMDKDKGVKIKYYPDLDSLYALLVIGYKLGTVCSEKKQGFLFNNDTAFAGYKVSDFGHSCKYISETLFRKLSQENDSTS
ncbi:hypothetical protein ACFL5V_12580 [Fibrobacterota bacterium]